MRRLIAVLVAASFSIGWSRPVPEADLLLPINELPAPEDLAVEKFGLFVAGMAYGSLAGPVVMSAESVEYRGEKLVEQEPVYVVGWFLHAGVTYGAFVLFPPAAIMYLATNGVIGGSQFARRGWKIRENH